MRRIVSNVGPELVWDLMDVRACDRIGMGRPKETPYRLRKYHSMIEEAMRAPVSVGMLKIDGSKIMELTEKNPGRDSVGYSTRSWRARLKIPISIRRMKWHRACKNLQNFPMQIFAR